MGRELSEQEIVRRESLQKLRELGVNPYPADTFDVNNTSKNIKNSYVNGDETEVIIAGRLMSRRVMGKASFAEASCSSLTSTALALSLSKLSYTSNFFSFSLPNK